MFASIHTLHLLLLFIQTVSAEVNVDWEHVLPKRFKSRSLATNIQCRIYVYNQRKIQHATTIEREREKR